MKKIIVSAAVLGMLAVTGVANAQRGMYKNTLKVGLSGGVAVPTQNTSAALGVDVAYQYLVTNHFGLGVATGYNHFFGRENNVGNVITANNNSVGVIPVAAALKYYPKAKGVFVGTDLGVGVLTGDDKVAKNLGVTRPDAGLYFKPQMGFHNKEWNVYAHYTKVFTGTGSNFSAGGDTQKYNVGAIGIGFSYNIGLGY